MVAELTAATADAQMSVLRSHPELGMRARMTDRPDEFFIKPAAIADELYHLYGQDRSAWSFLVELRPFRENW